MLKSAISMFFFSRLQLNEQGIRDIGPKHAGLKRKLARKIFAVTLFSVSSKGIRKALLCDVITFHTINGI